jgi:hypothetical protein
LQRFHRRLAHVFSFQGIFGYHGHDLGSLSVGIVTFTLAAPSQRSMLNLQICDLLKLAQMAATAAAAEWQFCGKVVTCKALMAPKCCKRRKCKSREKLKMLKKLKMLQLQLRDSDATAARFFPQILIQNAKR